MHEETLKAGSGNEASTKKSVVRFEKQIIGETRMMGKVSEFSENLS